MRAGAATQHKGTGTMTQFAEAFYSLVGQRVRAQAITCPITMSEVVGRGGVGVGGSGRTTQAGR